MVAMDAQVQLDKKDRLLLRALDFGSRSTYAQLGKAAGLSKQGAEYRLKRLMQEGVIQGFYPVVDAPRLGYLYCRLLLTLRDITRERRDEIVIMLRSHPKVFWLFSMQGMHDLLVVIWARNVREFKEFRAQVEAMLGERLKERHETIATDVVHLPHRYLLHEGKARGTGTGAAKELRIAETDERIAIDRKDERILRALCEDARSSVVGIAQCTGESASVVAYRLRRLEASGLVAAYRPIIDHRKLGYTYYKLFVRLSGGPARDLARLKAHVRASPLVVYMVEGIGIAGMLDIEVMVASNQELYAFVDDLRFRFPSLVGEYEALAFLETLKVRYLPF